MCLCFCCVCVFFCLFVVFLAKKSFGSPDHVHDAKNAISGTLNKALDLET